MSSVQLVAAKFQKRDAAFEHLNSLFGSGFPFRLLLDGFDGHRVLGALNLAFDFRARHGIHRAFGLLGSNANRHQGDQSGNGFHSAGWVS